MNGFHFKIDDESEVLLNEIIEMLIAFGGKSRLEAVTLINAYWIDYSDIRDVDYVFAETPYHWAMCMLHHPELGDGIINWYLDSRYMPPPHWVKDRYYNDKNRQTKD